MNIGIDISCLSAPKTGVGLYTYHLIQSLFKLDTVNRYYLFSSQPIDLSEVNLDTAQLIFSKYTKSTSPIWEQVILPKLLTQNKIDVFHSPNYIAPIFCGIPTVITVHDLSVFLFPELHPFYRRTRHNLLFPSSIKRATRIITVSEQTQRDLSSRFPYTTAKTVTIHNGLPNWFHNKTSKMELDFKLPDQYILFVGTLEPRKNLDLMLTAFAQVKKRNHLPHQLLVIGGEGWGKNHIPKKLRDYGIHDEVIFTGHLEHQQLPLIYQKAALLVFPSLYEGFGFPPLEAMASGIPVIASNISSIPEVVGTAGILLDPKKLDVWADTIYNVLTNEQLRHELCSKGFERAKLFSWEISAQKTIEVYHQAAKGTKT